MKTYLLTLALIFTVAFGIRAAARGHGNESAGAHRRATPVGLEAYINNGDPAGALPKDTNGNLTITAPVTVEFPAPDTTPGR